MRNFFKEIFSKENNSNLENKLIIETSLKEDILSWASNISTEYEFYYKNYKIEKLFLNILYKNSEITNFEIDRALENFILKQSRLNFNQSIGKSIFGVRYADHCNNPKYLAEGIVIKLFSASELDQINFDHGENEFNFYSKYGDKKLVENLRNELLDPKYQTKKTPEKQLELFKEKKSKSNIDFCC